jgi:hypothetical protein
MVIGRPVVFDAGVRAVVNPKAKWGILRFAQNDMVGKSECRRFLVSWN